MSLRCTLPAKDIQEGGQAQQRHIRRSQGERFLYHYDNMLCGGPPWRFLNEGDISYTPGQRLFFQEPRSALWVTHNRTSADF